MSHEMGNKVGRDGQYLRPLRGEDVDGRQVLLFGVSEYNEEVVILSTGTVKIDSWSSPAQHNYGAKGMILYWDIGAQNVTGTIALFVDALNPADPTSGWTAIYQTAYFGASGTITALKKYLFYPGAVDDGSQFTAVDRIPVPLHWRTRVLVSVTGAWSYSIAAQYLD
jgi:hypothetical protein